MLFRSLADRNVEDGAVLVLDNATGGILAYVASSGELSDAAQVDGITARRQAGSTLKPFLYELAIERRWLTAAWVLFVAALLSKTVTASLPAALLLNYRNLGWWLGHAFEIVGIAVVGFTVAVDLRRGRARSRPLLGEIGRAHV